MSPRVHALGLRSMGAGHDVRLDHMRHILLTWNPGPDNNEQWSPEEWRIKMVEGTSEGRTYGRGQRQCQTRPTLSDNQQGRCDSTGEHQPQQQHRPPPERLGGRTVVLVPPVPVPVTGCQTRGDEQQHGHRHG